MPVSAWTLAAGPAASPRRAGGPPPASSADAVPVLELRRLDGVEQGNPAAGVQCAPASEAERAAFISSVSSTTTRKMRSRSSPPAGDASGAAGATVRSWFSLVERPLASPRRRWQARSPPGRRAAHGVAEIIDIGFEPHFAHHQRTALGIAGEAVLQLEHLHLVDAREVRWPKHQVGAEQLLR